MYENQEAYGYSPYNDVNHFPNLDGLEAKIVRHLINSETKHADIFWKLLKYSDLSALSQTSVSKNDRRELVNNDNGEPTKKRVFFAPYIDDAQEVQCSSVYIYIDSIVPVDQTRAVVGVTIDTITHTKISAISGDGDPDSAEKPEWVNPNETDEQGSIVVPFKSRETVLVKCILAELNGLYLDGIGYLLFDNNKDSKGSILAKASVEMPFYHKSVYGHKIHFKVEISGVSDDAKIGY